MSSVCYASFLAVIIHSCSPTSHIPSPIPHLSFRLFFPCTRPTPASCLRPVHVVGSELPDQRADLLARFEHRYRPDDNSLPGEAVRVVVDDLQNMLHAVAVKIHLLFGADPNFKGSGVYNFDVVEDVVGLRGARGLQIPSKPKQCAQEGRLTSKGVWQVVMEVIWQYLRRVSDCATIKPRAYLSIT